ncbi:MAG: CBS domain-containing protein [Planctomycetota bacterium]
MNSPAHTCRPQDSMESAARLLWDHDVGMLPVVDAEGRVGATITDRDICMGAFTRGRPLAQLRVADAMSRAVVTCLPEEEVGVAAQRMAENQLRRLPVVDAAGKLCGVLTLNDLALAGEADTAIGREALKTLVAACRHRSRVPVATEAPPAAAGKPLVKQKRPEAQKAGEAKV